MIMLVWKVQIKGEHMKDFIFWFLGIALCEKCVNPRESERTKVVDSNMEYVLLYIKMPPSIL